jgi:short-subunit dehydrogenase
MKNILITGATSGIGKEAAYYLSNKGQAVFLTGRREEILENISNELENCLGTFAFDLANINEIQLLFDEIKNKGIKLDALIHCAGLEGGLAPARLAKWETLDLLLRVHYLSFVEMGKQFYKRGISNDGSVIIGMSSLAALMCEKNSIDYSGSKAAMNAAVKVMAKEFLKRNIRVNAILPANVDTPMCKNLKGTIDIEAIQPMGYIEPLQVVYLMDFLLSDKAKYITGALLPISAGMEY